MKHVIDPWGQGNGMGTEAKPKNKVREFLHTLVIVCHEPRRLAESFAPDSQVKGSDTDITLERLKLFMCT